MGRNSDLVSLFLWKLSDVFKVRDLGSPHFFLGIETVHSKNALLMSQARYMRDILHRAGMSDCKPIATPILVSRQAATDSSMPCEDPSLYHSLAGALQYLKVTRPDLSFAVNKLCQHMHLPFVDHWKALKCVLQYVKGTLNYGLRMLKSVSLGLHAFSDSN